MPDGQYIVTLASPALIGFQVRASAASATADSYYTDGAFLGALRGGNYEKSITSGSSIAPSLVWLFTLSGSKLTYANNEGVIVSGSDAEFATNGFLGIRVQDAGALVKTIEYRTLAQAAAAYAAAHPAPATTARTLSFNGAAGVPTGVEALTNAYGNTSGITLTGSGALNLGTNDGAVAFLSGNGVVGNGTVTVNYAAGTNGKSAHLGFGSYGWQLASNNKMELNGPNGLFLEIDISPSRSFGVSIDSDTALLLVDGKVAHILTADPAALWGQLSIGTAAYPSGTLIDSIVIDPTPLPAPVLAPLTVTPRQVSTSVPTGYPVLGAGVATVGPTQIFQAPGTLQTYAIAGADAASFYMRGDGYLTTSRPLSLGDKSISVTTTDAASGTSRTDALTIPVPQGNLIAAGSAGSVKLLNIPQNLNNNMMSPGLGTPTASGITGTKAWTISSPAGKIGVYGQIDCDTATGATAFVKQPAARADGHTFILTCSDGINTASEAFSVPVAFFVNPNAKVYVGPGNASTKPGYDHYHAHFDTLYPLIGAGYSLPDPAYAGGVIDLDDGGDDNYFADDFGTSYRDMMHGPLRIRNIGGPNGRRTRLGGRTDSYTFGYNLNQDKAAVLCNGGDIIFEGIRFSHCFGDLAPDRTYGGRTALRINGGNNGDVTADNCQFDNNSNGMEGGGGPNRITIKNCVFFNNGGSTQGSGQTHAAYIDAYELVYTNNLSYNNNVGHCLKTRCQLGTITDSTLADGAGGSASAQLNIPVLGTYLVARNVFHKGPTQQNPNCIGYGEDDYSRDRHDLLTLIDNTFFICAIDGSHNGSGRGITHFGRKNTIDGAYSKIVADRNSWFFSNPGTQTKIEAYNIAGDPDFGSGWTETNSTTLSVPPALNLADRGTANPPAEVPGRYNYLFYYGNDNYAYMDGLQITPSVKDIRVSASAAPGTVLATLTPYGADLFKVYNVPNDIRVNPFVNGGTWAISTAPEYFAGAVWPPDGRYEVVPSADGKTAELRVGTAGLVGNRVDTPKVQVTAPNGTIAAWRYPVSVFA